MIIKGRSRTHPGDLAVHLLRTDENERVAVIELRQVVGGNLHDALCEMDALKAATQARKGLYHAMINTRAEEVLDETQWREAVDRLEARLGFAGQPRAVVKHVKDGREHWHVVWARTDLARGRTIPDSHNYRKHEEVARALEAAFDHVPVPGVHVGRESVRDGDHKKRARPPRTPEVWEMQQQTRSRIAIKDIELIAQAAWKQADSPKAFRNALEHQGLLLARGERRSFVLVDIEGGMHSLSRRLRDVRAGELQTALEAFDLPSVEEAREEQARRRRARGEASGTPPLAPVPTLEELESGLLGTRSFFTRKQLEAHLAERGHAEVRRLARELVTTDGLLRLVDPVTGKFIGYTTKTVRAQEQDVLSIARRMAASERHIFGDRALRPRSSFNLSGEQEAAFLHALSPSALSLIEGRAGTGKTHLLQAILRAAEAQGYSVIGLAPTNTVTADLARAGFENARTVHSLLWWREMRAHHANARLDARTLIIVDEAAMLSTRITQKLLKEAQASGAKVIMVGDSRQLQSVERGGVFRDLTETLGAAQLTEVRRQREDWAKTAAQDFADGRFKDGLAAYEARGLIRWSDHIDEARARLIEAWARDTAGERGERFVFAYTNKEVDALNAALHALEKERGRIGASIVVETTRGEREIGEGDRVQFRANDKPSGVLNGALGTVTRIDDHVLTIRTDAGSDVQVDTRSYRAIDHGYAGTIYRGQGKTLEKSYVLHTDHWRDASSYVAMTRARGETELFVARSQARSVDDLAAQMSRRQSEGSTLRYEAQPVGRELGDRLPRDDTATPSISPRTDFNAQARMAVDLREGLERIRLEAQQTRSRTEALHQSLEARLQTPLSEAPHLTAEFAAADRRAQREGNAALAALESQQAQTREARTETLSRSFAASTRQTPEIESPVTGTPRSDIASEVARETGSDIDRTAQDILGKMRRDRDRSRDGREPR